MAAFSARFASISSSSFNSQRQSSTSIIERYLPICRFFFSEFFSALGFSGALLFIKVPNLKVSGNRVCLHSLSSAVSITSRPNACHAGKLLLMLRFQRLLNFSASLTLIAAKWNGLRHIRYAPTARRYLSASRPRVCLMWSQSLSSWLKSFERRSLFSMMSLNREISAFPNFSASLSRQPKRLFSCLETILQYSGSKRSAFEHGIRLCAPVQPHVCQALKSSKVLILTSCQAAISSHLYHSALKYCPLKFLPRLMRNAET